MIQRNDDDFQAAQAESDSGYADAPACDADGVGDAFWRDALDHIN